MKSSTTEKFATFNFLLYQNPQTLSAHSLTRSSSSLLLWYNKQLYRLESTCSVQVCEYRNVFTPIKKNYFSIWIDELFFHDYFNVFLVESSRVKRTILTLNIDNNSIIGLLKSQYSSNNWIASFASFCRVLWAAAKSQWSSKESHARTKNKWRKCQWNELMAKCIDAFSLFKNLWHSNLHRNEWIFTVESENIFVDAKGDIRDPT